MSGMLGTTVLTAKAGTTSSGRVATALVTTRYSTKKESIQTPKSSMFRLDATERRARPDATVYGEGDGNTTVSILC